MSWQNLTQEQLEALPTNRLIEVFKRQRTWTYSIRGHACDCGEDFTCYTEDAWDIGDVIERDRREKRLDAIKAILSTRGHIGPDRKTNKTKDIPKRDRYRSLFRPKPAREIVGPIGVPSDAIGLQVMKLSKKPFKSKKLYNTVMSITTNPHTKRVAFQFEDDDSIVDVAVCKLRCDK